MSLRGVKQLRELVIRYSDYDGSSRGIREWIRTSLVDYAQNNPETMIKTELKRNKHPIFRAYYKNTNVKVICVKNLQPTQINEYAQFLRNQIGRRVKSHFTILPAKTNSIIKFSCICCKYIEQIGRRTDGYKRPVLSQKPSIQGEWNERLDLLDMKLTIDIK